MVKRKLTCVVNLIWLIQKCKQLEEQKQNCGPLLITKAEKFAKLLDHENFVCTTGWLDRFKNVQLICDLGRVEHDLQMQYFATRKQTQITGFFNTCQ